MAAHFGHPDAKRLIASVMERSNWLASDVTQAITSPSSWSCSSREPLRAAFANSPTSSASHATDAA